MPAILISLLKRFGPYAAALAIGLAAGAWVAHRLDLGTIEQARAAVARQQAANASAVAQANAEAAAALAAANRRADAAEGALAAERSTGGASLAAAEAQVKRDATLPGNDGPVAPVLANALRAIAGGK